MNRKVIVGLFILFSLQCFDSSMSHSLLFKGGEKIQPAPAVNLDRIRLHAITAKEYCKAHHLNTDFFILIDLGIHSGIKRFFIWEFDKDTITYSFLVSHGCHYNSWGSDLSKDKADVSNEDGSHCSSVGKYIIGERSYSEWGINVKYMLYGQDSTNSNALKREIVLHGWDLVSDHEIFPQGTPEGWGCPAISNNSMKIVDDKLINSSKNVLLWTIN